MCCGGFFYPCFGFGDENSRDFLLSHALVYSLFTTKATQVFFFFIEVISAVRWMQGICFKTLRQREPQCLTFYSLDVNTE